MNLLKHWKKSWENEFNFLYLGMLKELIEKVDEKIYEQVFLGKLSLTQKANPKFQATHMSITKTDSGFDEVKYYRKKV